MSHCRSASLFLIAALAVSAAPIAHGAPKPKATPKKPAQPGVRGTQQMAGAQGAFGETYTLKSGFNFTLVSAEYSLSRVSAQETLYADAGDKLLVLHYRIKNSAKDDMFFDRSVHTLNAIDSKGEGHTGGSIIGRTSTGAAIEPTLKPGQGYNDCYTAIKVPAQGAVAKLILNQGRLHTSEDVIRYTIGEGKNAIAPLPDYARDPADPSGDSVLAQIPAKLGVSYPLQETDLTLEKVEFTDQPIRDSAPDDGKRYLVATVLIKNQTSDELGLYVSMFTAKIANADGDTFDSKGLLRTNSDENLDAKLKSGGTYRARWYFSVPKDGSLKTIIIAESESHQYTFDISNVK
ncbi:MAG: DUF4352 domain-containing protein [Capsulimonas sp.]|uniref:DUF4352 domain-containing protein n=1 Tax=Capsulimonas sp. TaxID=2494211 RepID=UPI003263D3FE